MIGNNKKTHFVSEVRILRQYERSELVTCHVLFPLGNDIAKLQGKESNNMIFVMFMAKNIWEHSRSKKKSTRFF